MSFGPGKKLVRPPVAPKAASAAPASLVWKAPDAKSPAKKTARMADLCEEDKAKIGTRKRASLQTALLTFSSGRQPHRAVHAAETRAQSGRCCCTNCQHADQRMPQASEAFQTERVKFEQELDRVKRQNDEIVKHSLGVKSRFNHSLTLLRSYQARLSRVRSLAFVNGTSLKCNAHCDAVIAD